ncbi:PREDICTED: zinc finger protein ZAT1-like [Ipomoea nil]|uniref:zinc finger protein ZAT1-like n=1 Tax=Ipomoea nil TaxID=35883 RepID=UPI00090164F8|nr:PREDICTED: zinc finger protein ZAT1-like [Ipomoea nil]
MAMEKQKCKLCWKEFANGKALGGHMRSHFAPLPMTPPQKQDSGGVDPTGKPAQGRSKRARRLFVSEENEESADQGAKNEEEMGKTAKLEENIAMCLLMLSDDVRGDSGTMKRRKKSKDKENFRCEICNGVFKCSQALGSHRTAHRNKTVNAGAGAGEKLRNLGVKNSETS